MSVTFPFSFPCVLIVVTTGHEVEKKVESD
jgi:hypothetical protein